MIHAASLQTMEFYRDDRYKALFYIIKIDPNTAAWTSYNTGTAWLEYYTWDATNTAGIIDRTYINLNTSLDTMESISDSEAMQWLADRGCTIPGELNIVFDTGPGPANLHHECVSVNVGFHTYKPACKTCGRDM